MTVLAIEAATIRIAGRTLLDRGDLMVTRLTRARCR
jgi:hypothetical protein